MRPALVLTTFLVTAGCAPLFLPPPEPGPPPAAVAAARGPRSIPLRDRFARARLDLLRSINADRLRAGLAPVELDSLATIAAQRHAEAMAAGRFYSHYDLTGRAPYERLAALGATDHVVENVFRWEERDEDPLLEDDPWRRFDTDEAHAALMASPLHRAPILDPHRTGVGIGFAVDGDGRAVLVAEEFVARHAAVEGVPARMHGRPARISGRVLAAGLGPLAIVLHQEPAKRRDEPPPGPYYDGASEAHLLPPWSFTTRADGSFAIDLSGGLPPGRYYAILYVAPRREIDLAVARRRAYPGQGWPGAAFVFEVSAPATTPVR